MSGKKVKQGEKKDERQEIFNLQNCICGRDGGGCLRGDAVPLPAAGFEGPFRKCDVPAVAIMINLLTIT